MIRLDTRRLRLVAALLVSIVVVIAFEWSPVLRSLIVPLQQATASAAAYLMNTLGMSVARDGIVLTHASGFRAAVSYGCTPLIPVVFLSVIMVFGISLQRRTCVLGLLSGVAVLTLLNLLRVVALFAVGVTAPELFAFSHEWLGQGVVIAATAVIVGYWIARAAKPAHLHARL